MKIRTGFVSNSSSSSFICNVCNIVETGYDGEYSFSTSFCEVGHDFCSDHLDYLKKLPLEYKAKLALEDKYFAEELKDEEIALVKKGNSFAMEDIVERFMDSWDEVPSSVCPICSLVNIPDWAIMKHLLEQCETTKEEVTVNLKNKYRNLKELKKALA